MTRYVEYSEIERFAKVDQVALPKGMSEMSLVTHSSSAVPRTAGGQLQFKLVS